MRNNRLSPMTLAAGALAVAMIAGSADVASARDYDGDRSWNGSNRVENGSGNTRRGNATNHRRDDDDNDRGRNNNGGWNGGRDRGHVEGYGHRHHHWRGRYNPWWRYSRDEYYGDRYDGPRRHWWNRYN